MTRTFTAALLAASLASAPAHASAKAAEDCLRTKIWEGYRDGWAIRTSTSTELQAGRTRNYVVTLYKGNEYRIQTCGDEAVGNLDVLLYDTEGNLISRDTTTDREPMLAFTPPETGTYHVVLYLRSLEQPPTGGVAMAVVYR